MIPAHADDAKAYATNDLLPDRAKTQLRGNSKVHPHGKALAALAQKPSQT
jgi:hypothetical protein